MSITISMYVTSVIIQQLLHIPLEHGLVLVPPSIEEPVVHVPSKQQEVMDMEQDGHLSLVLNIREPVLYVHTQKQRIIPMEVGLVLVVPSMEEPVVVVIIKKKLIILLVMLV